MGMVKAKYIDHLIQMDQFKEGLIHLQKYGKKSFQDAEGNWVEMRPAQQPNLLNDEVEIIPHKVENFA